MGLVEEIDRFRELLSHATGSVGRNYFMLPVADGAGGEPLVQYRERVYAYELYHCLRCVWPDWPYSLGGEVDKRRHPVVRGGDLDNVKPDFLVHVPGKMNHNLVVLEIKAASQRPPADERVAIEKDLKKLTAFCERAQYEIGILLVFGEGIYRIKEHAVWALSRGVSLDAIELWHHPKPGAAARRVTWNNSGA